MPSPESSPLHIPNRPVPCLRLDLSNGESLVLPWHQMIFARLDAAGTQLLIRFGCGDAVIAGEGLKEVREALWSQEAGRIGPGEDTKERLMIASVTFKEFKAGGGEDGEDGGVSSDNYKSPWRQLKLPAGHQPETGCFRRRADRRKPCPSWWRESLHPAAPDEGRDRNQDGHGSPAGGYPAAGFCAFSPAFLTRWLTPSNSRMMA